MYSSVNTIWVLLGAALVFLMQAGFAMCEAGFTRAKNTGNILMKNLMDFCIGTPTYWILGFGLMFAGSGALIGGLDPFVRGDYSAVLPDGVPLFAYLIFQTVFCATAATIVSGSMAERTKYISYCIYSFCISAFIYPVSGHWIWGGGWLSQLGFHDFAGSTAVHMVGGVCACIGAAILGPRLGKYDREGKPRAILGHSLSLGALGVFILWFCWFRLLYRQYGRRRCDRQRGPHFRHDQYGPRCSQPGHHDLYLAPVQKARRRHDPQRGPGGSGGNYRRLRRRLSRWRCRNRYCSRTDAPAFYQFL
jgi:Amt family ammonium transporter